MAKFRDEIVANAMRSWKQKDRTNENWFKSIVEGAWNSGYKRGVDDAAQVDLVKKMSYWWIPVTERLPEDGTEVLAFNKTGFAYVDCWTDGKWKINSMVDEEHESVTHWMQLPEPPKDGET